MPKMPDSMRLQACIPADPGRLPLLRSMAAALAIALDFDLDTMSDMRMAVDELGSTVVTRARPGSTVTCTFVAVDAVVSVTAVATLRSDEPVDRGSFGWMVLTTLASDVTAEIRTVGGEPELTMSLNVQPPRADR
jgi:serine/threonine-protein kinase RsbW